MYNFSETLSFSAGRLLSTPNPKDIYEYYEEEEEKPKRQYHPTEPTTHVGDDAEPVLPHIATSVAPPTIPTAAIP